jgi:hypothetical protein
MMKVKEGNIVVSGVYIYIYIYHYASLLNFHHDIFGFLEFDRTKNK